MMQTDFILAFTPSAGGFPELVTTYQPVMWEAFFRRVELARNPFFLDPDFVPNPISVEVASSDSAL
jgi:hypothetical protein